MLVVLKFSFLIVLLIVAYQDFKDREVTVLLFPLLLMLGIIMHYNTQYLEAFLLNLMMSFGLLSIILLLLLVYVKLIMKKKFNEVIGLGDLLFFMVLAVSFPTITFVVLFCLSLLFSLTTYLFLKSRFGKYIPLAGLQGLFLFLVLLSNSMFNFVNLYAV